MSEARIRSAFVLAAGKGERLRPYTLTTPKPLLPISGKPLLYHVLKNLEVVGLERVVVNAWYLSEQIEKFASDFANAFSFELKVSVENRLLGTGGGLKKAFPLLLPGPLLMVNGDCLWKGRIEKFVERSLAIGPERSLAASEDFSQHWWLAPQSLDQTLIEANENEVVKIGDLWQSPRAKLESPSEGSFSGTFSGTFSGIQIFREVRQELLPEVGCILRDYLLKRLLLGERLRADGEDLEFWTDVGTPERYQAAAKA